MAKLIQAFDFTLSATPAPPGGPRGGPSETYAVCLVVHPGSTLHIGPTAEGETATLREGQSVNMEIDNLWSISLSGSGTVGVLVFTA